MVALKEGDQQKASSNDNHHWIWWGFDSLRQHRTPLLLCAFILNFTAIAGITVAAMAIKTSPVLAKVAWASGTTTLSISNSSVECSSSSNSAIDERITIQVWLGLKGYYGQCHVSSDDDDNNNNKTVSSTTYPHSDTFCSRSINWSKEVQFVRGRNSTSCDELALSCELLTHGMRQDDSGEDNEYCSSCKDTSRNCVGTLLSAAAFGVFPLVLTIRRLGWLCSPRWETGLRLRTLFFSGLAIVFGLHAFVRFHFKCVNTMPLAFSVLVCSPQECNNQQPFLVSVPLEFELFAGGKLVIVAAVLKCSYFILHLITPVAKNHSKTAREREAATMGERQILLSNGIS